MSCSFFVSFHMAQVAHVIHTIAVDVPVDGQNRHFGVGTDLVQQLIRMEWRM